MSASGSPLAIITGRHAPELSEGGQQLASLLADRGFDPTPVMWTDRSVDWVQYDSVLFRSCWDYPDDIPRFQELLDDLDRAEATVCNPLEVVRWNLHKRYLTALADAGVEIPATVVIPQGTDRSLETVLREQEWAEAVVKPAIGAMSSNVWWTSRRDARQYESRFAALLADQDVLVQAYVPEITTGERSIVFFAGEYSHAWNSLPAPDDITSFEDTDAAYTPTPAIQEQATTVESTARAILEVDPWQLPYARIDFVPREGTLVLMELELIEPYLGFERGEGSIERLGDALVTYFERAD